MNYNIISSGSQGNAVLLQGGILVDCGVTFKTLNPVLYDVTVVLLTHCHGDHFNRSTVRQLAELQDEKVRDKGFWEDVRGFFGRFTAGT